MSTLKIVQDALLDSYSGARYGEAALLATARMLRARGLTPRQIRAVLFSTHMRHAADLANDEGLETALERYIVRFPRYFTERGIAALVEVSF